MSEPPSDRELLEALGGSLAGNGIVALRRRPYRYATSAPLEEVTVTTDGGFETILILKDLDRRRLLGDASTTKPTVLYEPRREIETYRRIIGPAGIGPTCHAAVDRENPDRHWLLLEKVAGVELWQIGELGTWEEAARWLGGLHRRFQGRRADLRLANPYLLDHTRGWYESWCERAIRAVAGSGDSRGEDLGRALSGYGAVAESLANLPPTLIHGEMYPANVLVSTEREDVEILPVDWEMSATGPGAIDLAALTAGWDERERERLVAAYQTGAGGAASGQEEYWLAAARLHLALQWLGWAEGWTPPPEHAKDWLAEALAAAAELRLL